MSNKTLIGNIALFAMLFPALVACADTDAGFRDRIAGTWHGEYEWHDRTHPDSWIKARSEDHYRQDGILVGNIDYEYPDRKDNFEYEARWSIQDGYLLVEITRSSGGFLVKGNRTRDEIVSLSNDKMELLAEDGNLLILRKTD